MSLCQVCEAGLHISLGIGMRLFSYLQHDCQQLDLLICLDKDEADLSEVEKQLVATLVEAQELETEAADLTEEAGQHQTVHDWFCAVPPVEDLEANQSVPIDEQLAELRRTIKEQFKLVASKVSIPTNRT